MSDSGQGAPKSPPNDGDKSSEVKGHALLASEAPADSKVPPEVPAKSDGALFKVEVHHTDEEVAERLFTIPKEVSSVWNYFSSKVEQATAKLSQAAESTHKQFLSEKEKCMSTPSKVLNRSEVGKILLPWEPESSQSSNIKERVLKLALDDKTFTTPPSSAVDFTFDFNSSSAEAMAMLEADPTLSIKRFKLVPRKVKEDEFWRNYFYRVFLIRDSHDDGRDEEEDGDDIDDAAHDIADEVQLMHMDNVNTEASRIARADTDELLGEDDHDDGLNFASEDPLLALDAAQGDDALDADWELSLKAELAGMDDDLDVDVEDLEKQIKDELKL